MESDLRTLTLVPTRVHQLKARPAPHEEHLCPSRLCGNEILHLREDHRLHTEKWFSQPQLLPYQQLVELLLRNPIRRLNYAVGVINVDSA